MKMFILLLISCEVMRCASPAAASTTVLVDQVGGDTASDVSLMTLFLKNILNLGLGSAATSTSSTSSTARPTSTSTPAQPNTRTCDKNIIRAFVDVKVKELMPFLQDDDYAEAEVEVEAEAEGDTAIVQPPPELVALRQRPHNESVRRYRRLRRRIHRALLRETVSNDTLHLIIQTIDEMIASIVAGRCAVRGGARGGARGEGPPPPPEPRAVDAASRPVAWRLEWQKIREKYSDLFRGNDSAPRQRLNEIVASLMDKLPSFFADVLRDGETLAERYGVRCERTRPASAGGAGSAGGAAPGRSRALAGNATCVAATRICSGELRRFLVRLFKLVNESSSRVLQDYLEMYKIDVNIDPAGGRRGVVSTLREINHEAETEVCKIFAKKIRSLVTKEGKKRGLYEVDLKHLIKDVTENVKMNTNEIVRVEMEPIDTELKERILKDLEDNMRVELDRLAREAELTVCSAFATCNGRYSVRRAGPASRGVFVRVQLQLEEQLEEQPARTPRPAPRRTAPPPSQYYTSFGLSEAPIQIKYSTFNKKMYDIKPLNVTRTTTSYSENSNTKVSQ